VFGSSDDAEQSEADNESDLDFGLDDDLSADSSTDSAEPFAFDTTVTQVEDADDSAIDDSLEDLAAELPDSDAADGEFELDLDLETEDAVDNDLGALADEIADDAAADFDQPGVDTGQFSTNVDIAPLDDAVADTALAAESEVEDFELDLDIADDSTRELADLEADVDSLGDDLGLDLPDDADELERVVAATDDDQLLDEIERSLDELETDGLLSSELSDDGDFSFDDDADTSATKLDLARAYIDMGDDDGAREILGEVITEGDTNQQGEASELLDKL